MSAESPCWTIWKALTPTEINELAAAAVVQSRLHFYLPALIYCGKYEDGGINVKQYYPEGWTATGGAGSAQELMKVCDEGAIIEATAYLCDARHDLWVDFGFMKGKIPRCEAAIGIEDGSVRDIAIISRVNKPVCFKVTGFSAENGETVAVLSRRMAQEECKAEYLDRLLPGCVIDAVVTYNESFGSFVDVGCGISALMHIDTISVSRIAHPSERFSVGQRIKAAVSGFDAKGRLCLTHRELLGTWAENAAAYSVGQTVCGIVRSVESYGIFVELTPNLAGLAELREGISVGDSVSVYIKSIIAEKMKIKLIILDSEHKMLKPPRQYDYFIQEGAPSRWRYSPPGCDKLIETVFR